ncbi:AsmA family protein [Aeromonas cavernicola]|uniref:AsmA family protein n=1 Tax=Aeromonas cavernicola TaxID=1006623 RepID=A0A2H9U4S6_9GAMM|nr:AsmA family protein [Aeromonas cavernicola]PJG59043.1 AsmA family protein [Aeromonas cavernicola]
MKKVIYILLGLVMATLLAGIALVSLLNPNQFKPALVELVRNNTGRELVIDGDIGWRFWPTIGLSLERVAIRNPAGFDEPDLLRFERGEASVALLPLLSRQLAVGTVTLAGAHLFIQTKPDGDSNLTGLVQTRPAATPPASAVNATAAQGASQPWQISLQGVVLAQASAVLRDDRSGRQFQLAQLDLELGQLAAGQWVPITVVAKGTQGPLGFDLSGKAELKLAPTMLASELQKLTLTGSIGLPDRRVEALSVTADRLAVGQWGNLAIDLKAALGAPQPSLTGDVAGTLKVKLDQGEQQLTVAAVQLTATLQGPALAKPRIALALSGAGHVDLARQQLVFSQIALKAEDTQLAGDGRLQLGAIPKLALTLKGDRLDLDSWFPSSAAGSSASAKAAGPAPSAPDVTPQGADKRPALATTEPDLQGLQQFDVSAQLQLDRLRLKGLEASAIDLQLALQGGQLTLTKLNAKVAGGEVRTTGQLDARHSLARYQLSQQIVGVNVQPLLQALANSNQLIGKGDLAITLQGVGLSEQALSRHMQGKVALALRDGALNGIHLGQMIREARATLSGKGLTEVQEARRTDFAALSANFQIANGLASSQDIALFAPALRVKGQGQTELAAQTLDFLLQLAIVESSKGQGGKDVDELKDLSIPVRIGGHWLAPTYRLDVKSLLSSNVQLEQKARREAERGLNKLLGDKANHEGVKKAADQLLKGLFN